MENKILQNVGEKLGLGEEPAVIHKCGEFLRVLQTKSSIKNLNDTAKAILCFDLGASILGIGFDKETAIKLSGLKKSVYQNNLHIVEKVLELDKPLTIGELCVKLSCTVVRDLAEKILKLYKEQSVIVELEHPQYIAAAVHSACKLKQIKYDKQILVSISHLKPSQWKELENEFDKFVSKVGFNVEKNSKRKGRSDINNYLEEYAQNNENKTLKSPQKKYVEEPVHEDYEIWKERILKAAQKELLK